MQPPIHVYQLAPPGVLHAHEADLARVLFELPSADHRQRHFRVSEISGCLTFTDNHQSDHQTARVSDTSTARRVAEGFLTAASRRFIGSKLPSKGVPPPLPVFPIRLEHGITQAVRRQGSSTTDHWLCRFTVRVQSGMTADAAPVDGAVIELRVSSDGRVTGLRSTWRPVLGEPQTTVRLPPAGLGNVAPAPIIRPISPPDPPHGTSGSGRFGSERSSEGNTPALIYKVADENEIQTHLAPYYQITQSSDVRTLPASSYSLTVEVHQEATADGLRLHAAVGGATNPERLTYQWVSAGEEPGIGRVLGNGRSTAVGAGLHNIVLTVHDALTGVTIQASTTLLSGGI